MEKRRILIFLFPLLLALFSAPALFGWYTVDRIPERNISDHITKLIVDLDQANGPYPEEYKGYIISALKSERSKVELLEIMLRNLKEGHNSMIKQSVIIFFIQIILAALIVKYSNHTKIHLKSTG